MTFSIRDARRSEAKPLIGLYGQSGSGKTMGGLLLSRGFVGSKGRVLMIETESGRGEAYSDILPGGYQVISLRNDFSPVHFGEAISTAEKAEVGALLIDSASLEWEGVGGVLDLAAQNQAAGKKGPLVWQQPKMLHQRHFMLRLLATPIPLVIVCMRAKYPMQEKTISGRKEWVRSNDLEPIQASDILYEMFVHGWLDQHHRLHVTKLTRPDLAQVFRDGELITVETGQRLATWSKGDNAVQSVTLVNRGPGYPTEIEVHTSAAVQVPRPAADAAPSSEPLESPSHDGAVLPIEDQAREAARRGKIEMRLFWNNLDKDEQRRVQAIRSELNRLVDAAEAELATG